MTFFACEGGQLEKRKVLMDTFLALERLVLLLQFLVRDQHLLLLGLVAALGLQEHLGLLLELLIGRPELLLLLSESLGALL